MLKAFKISSVIIVALLLLTISVSCGGKQTSTPTPTPMSTYTPTPPPTTSTTGGTVKILNISCAPYYNGYYIITVTGTASGPVGCALFIDQNPLEDEPMELGAQFSTSSWAISPPNVESSSDHEVVYQAQRNGSATESIAWTAVFLVSSYNSVPSMGTEFSVTAYLWNGVDNNGVFQYPLLAQDYASIEHP